MARELIAEGKEAMQRTAKAMQYADDWTFTDQFGTKQTLHPGDVWGSNMMFAAKADGVYYTEGDKLYKLGEGDFIRDIYMDALTKGVSRAAWLVPILKAEMTFVMALVGTMAALVGTIAAVSVGLGKLVSFYSKNREAIQIAQPIIQALLKAINHFKNQCPKLYSLIRNKILIKVLTSMPDGVSMDDVAYFLGKLLGGIASAPAVGLKVVLGALKTAFTLLIALRGAPIAARGSVKNVKDFIEKMKKEGITISEEEAKQILQDTCLDTKQNREKFEEIMKKVKELDPIIKKLAAAAKEL